MKHLLIKEEIELEKMIYIVRGKEIMLDSEVVVSK